MPRVDDFLHALILAREKLHYLDPEGLCRNAGPECLFISEEKKIILPFLGRKVEVTYPEGTVGYCEDKDSLSLQEQGLILHYLLGVRDIPCTGELITFREIPSGEFYYQPFLKRVQAPLIMNFGSDQELLRRTGAKLGGKDVNLGDVSMCFLPLPKIPITLILWKGDEEFPPTGTVLFDSSIKSFFPAEDIAFLAGSLVYKLMALSRA